MNDSEVYDVIIVGAGPAGLAAGLYAARDRYKTLLLEKNGLPGGQIMLTDRVENYPGIVRVGGFELIEEQKKQVLNFGAAIAANQGCTSLKRLDDGLIQVEVNRGEKTYFTRAVILSPGSDYRRLGVPGEDEMRQATRVSYCATCDGAFYRDKEVLAVGGGNTAGRSSSFDIAWSSAARRCSSRGSARPRGSTTSTSSCPTCWRRSPATPKAWRSTTSRSRTSRAARSSRSTWTACSSSWG
jgi:thioredoxin reductase (NADPH)